MSTIEQLDGHQQTANLARLVAHSGYLAWTNTLVGDRAPVVTDCNKRMRDPQIGDLVLETSTYYREPWDPGALGWLLSVDQEPWYTEEDGTVLIEQVWYVEPFVPRADGEFKVRWTNAMFIALPDALRWVPRV